MTQVGLHVSIFETREDSSAHKSISMEPDYKGATIVHAVVILGGDGDGKPCVDLVFETYGGKTYVATLKGALLRMLPC
jgi:hypothetical protein